MTSQGSDHNSLAHKSENVYNLSDILIREHDVRMYFMGPHKILHFAGSGHRRILELWIRQPAIPRSLEYRTILYKTTFVLDKL